ncbi:hypothetical protein GLOTRDRAFT_82380 [Gloeophyllum trabeum ATCC 11539]|uniref:BTB domain-containing protein n=1 Tax=Gloeophyllum trabeum (strain ATCC 11539 / FP-39264 / Madison 617) TaxID=670483 RepID=S7PR75_GLOTA|nr:uncharacterized protein GLOTRDRAFT_82380 [Gloeophyllum trabeum ATCC 11539]EPQ50346.1 hypothetical protein GLOTRDRAFT_82380 [Gloeophyllum trabeum ATCC 11539]
MDLTRCDDLWFEDGNVVLQAEQKLFRVYRGLLADSSSTFSEMFKLPQPDSAEQYDDCPLITMPDSAEELEYLLNAVFKPGYLESMLCKNTAFLIGALRLSTKYNIQSIRRRIVDELALIYPRTLQGFYHRVRHPVHEQFIGKAYIAAELARVGEAPILLPAILYCCATYTTETILDDNGPVGLNWSEKRACIMGRERIMVAYRKLEKQLKPQALPPTVNCELPGGQRCEIQQGVWVPLLQKRRKLTAHWFMPMLSHGNDLSWGPGVCFSCFDAMKTLYHNELNAIWEKLPEYFGLPSWEDLRAASDL